MNQDCINPLFLVLRSIGWPFLKQLDAYYCDRLGEQVLVKKIDLSAADNKLTIIQTFLKESQEAGIKNVVVDLEKVLEVHSTLLGFYCFLKQEVEKVGGEIVFAHPTNRVFQVIKFVELDKVFTLVHSLEEALDILSEKGS